jgi:hypothetical protein
MKTHTQPLMTFMDAAGLAPERRITMKSDKYVAKYVPLGYRTISPEEMRTRRTAWDLKIPTEEAIQIAAPGMAALIDGNCWLVPVPSSNGNLSANLALARSIAEMVPGARVTCAIGRAHGVESSSHRRSRGLFGLTILEHAIIRTAALMQRLPVYFVDNVITTGTTIAACRRALGWGMGLCYADASTSPIAWMRDEVQPRYRCHVPLSFREGHFYAGTAFASRVLR